MKQRKRLGVPHGTISRLAREADPPITPGGMLARLRRERGICTRCGDPAQPGKSQCGPCAKLVRDRVRAKRNCVTGSRCCRLCGKPGHNRQSCEEAPLLPITVSP